MVLALRCLLSCDAPTESYKTEREQSRSAPDPPRLHPFHSQFQALSSALPPSPLPISPTRSRPQHPFPQPLGSSAVLLWALLPSGHHLAPRSWRTVGPHCFLLQTSSKGGFSSSFCLQSSMDFLNLLQLQPNSLMSLNSDFRIQFTYFKSILMGLPSKCRQHHWSRFSEISCAPSLPFPSFPPSLLSFLPLPPPPLHFLTSYGHISHVGSLFVYFASLNKNKTETVKPLG